MFPETSPTGFRCGIFCSSWWLLKSADEAAVETLLCLEEVSVEMVLVVLDDPLPLYIIISPWHGGGSVTSVF